MWCQVTRGVCQGTLHGGSRHDETASRSQLLVSTSTVACWCHRNGSFDAARQWSGTITVCRRAKTPTGRESPYPPATRLPQCLGVRRTDFDPVTTGLSCSEQRGRELPRQLKIENLPPALQHLRAVFIQSAQFELGSCSFADDFPPQSNRLVRARKRLLQIH